MTLKESLQILLTGVMGAEGKLYGKFLLEFKIITYVCFVKLAMDGNTVKPLLSGH